MGGAATAEHAGPVRTCVGCRARVSANELIRVVSGGAGTVRVGRGLAGRGAWIHPGAECLEAAGRRQALGRALRADVAPEQIDLLRPVLTGRARIGEQVSGTGPEKGHQG